MSRSSPQARSLVAGNSFLQNAVLGVGKLYTDMGFGARQMIGQAQDALWGPSLSGLITGKTRTQQLQQEAADKRALDAPLANTVCYESEHKKVYYPSRRDEEAINPDGTKLR